MQDIIIVCAGSYGKDLYRLIGSINRHAKAEGKEEPYNILGFLSDVPDALDGIKIDSKIIGDIQNWQPKGSEVYALGISSPKSKEKLSTLLKDRGAKFETLVRPGLYIPETTEIGEGSIITAYHIGDNVKIGSFVLLGGCEVGNDATVGDYSTIMLFSNITNATLGKRVIVGSHAVILENRKVGDDAFVCVGSVVVRNVKPGTKVFGVPAQRVEW
ncbi:MAG: hypothetical protein IJU26_03275 [Synergistaceae bacterium]|nr:hypothetical protein [Synergistaceae bacterium]